MDPMEKYLRPTPTFDCDNESIKGKAQDLSAGQEKVADRAKSLFYFVRDEIKYNIYVLSDLPEYYRGSRILEVGEGFCIQKAVLLATLARAVGIPARLHLAAIRNHLVPDKLKELMGTNLFPSHGYAELYIEGKWVKATPAFDLKMCQQNRISPVEFDGKNDAMFHSHNLDGKLHIEYIQDRGHFDDLPFDTITNLRIQALGADIFQRLRQAIEARKAQA
ncbi:MAG: transglutaminase domain-containing protein [Dehalococcoidia bacterium]|nr:transglutaminase domain-containing protein [Dehalococcoidia bacterium]